MEDLIINDLMENVEEEHILKLLDKEAENAEIYNKVHNTMSRRYYAAFVSSTILIQGISIAMGLASVLGKSKTFIIVGTSINTLITGVMFNTLDISGKSKVHRILSKKYKKIKQFCSLRSIYTAKQIYSAIQILNNEISSLNDIFVPTKVLRDTKRELNIRDTIETNFFSMGPTKASISNNHLGII